MDTFISDDVRDFKFISIILRSSCFCCRVIRQAISVAFFSVLLMPLKAFRRLDFPAVPARFLFHHILFSADRENHLK